MKWTPIEVYDAMETKPHGLVVFLVAKMAQGRMTLPETISNDRMMGWRTVTHFCVLPDAPTHAETLIELANR